VSNLTDADLPALRRRLRAQRRALTPAQQRAAAHRLARTVIRSVEFARARHIALYLPVGGEIDPGPIAARARARGKRTFLPVLHPLAHDRMLFVAWDERTILRRNRLDIAEPASLRGAVRPWQLDLVLAPLVAFDGRGNRLGAGGGFYDRTFARVRMARWPRRPLLCGLAHAFQQVPALPVRHWDVPLQRVFTDRGNSHPK
jgi:5-formyltetrahydrofolate cyclo-ligase